MNTLESLPSDALGSIRSFLPYEQKNKIKLLSKSTKQSIKRGVSKRQILNERIDYYSDRYERLKPKIDVCYKEPWGYDSNDFEYNPSFILKSGWQEESFLSCTLARVDFKDYIALRIGCDEISNINTDIEYLSRSVAIVLYLYAHYIVKVTPLLLTTALHAQLFIRYGELPLIVNTTSIEKLLYLQQAELVQMIVDKFTPIFKSEHVRESLLKPHFPPVEQMEYENLLEDTRNIVRSSVNQDAQGSFYYDLPEKKFYFYPQPSTGEIEFERKIIDTKLKSIDRYLSLFPSQEDIQLLASFVTVLDYGDPKVFEFYFRLISFDGMIDEEFSTFGVFTIDSETNNLDSATAAVSIALLLSEHVKKCKNYILNRIINL